MLSGYRLIANCQIARISQDPAWLLGLRPFSGARDSVRNVCSFVKVHPRTTSPDSIHFTLNRQALSALYSLVSVVGFSIDLAAEMTCLSMIGG